MSGASSDSYAGQPPTTPLQPGPVLGPVTSSGAAASSSAPPKKWFKGKKGQKALKRAIEHREGGQEAWDRLGAEPSWASHEQFTRSTSWLSGWRRDSMKECSRLLLFLLQLCIVVVRSWRARQSEVKEFGLGARTNQRLALLFHKQSELDEGHLRNIERIGHTLFMRALREGETLAPSLLAETIKTQNEYSDVQSSCSPEFLHDWFVTHLCPRVLAGRLPRVDADGNVEDRARTAMWELLASACLVLTGMARSTCPSHGPGDSPVTLRRFAW